jgi:hypothetical protein
MQRSPEGLRFVRLMMVVSSLTPLFLLWAVRGMQPVPDRWLMCICAALITIPNVVLVVRLKLAMMRGDMRTLDVERAEDHRDHLMVYLFAVLMPLFDANISRPRDSVATILALAFVVFLFWHLNLHYMNVFFAIAGYRVFTIHGPGDPQPMVLLTKSNAVDTSRKIHAYRLCNTVLIEVKKT